MVEPTTRSGPTAVVTLTALAVAFSLSVPAVATGGRSVSSHVVIGLTPNTGFGVSVNGQEVEGAPFTASDLGIMRFDVDESGLPPGPRSITIGDSGELVIYGVHVDSVTSTTAVVAWTTSLPSNSMVEYGVTEAYGLEAGDQSLATSHEVPLAGLAPGTTYHFRVMSDDGQGHAAVSGDRTFQTDTEPLIVDGVQVDDVGQTWAVVSWSTDRPAIGWVDYGTTPAYGDVEVPETGFVTEHSATLSGLAEGTLYHYKASSRDANEIEASSADSTFMTMEGDPTGPPAIGGIDCHAVSATSVVISWSTDRPASSQVRYGAKGELDCSTPVDTTAVLDHSVFVWPVAPRVEYAFVVVSACGADTAVSDPSTFRAFPPPGVEPQVRPVDVIKVDIDPGESSAQVSWATDRPCSSWVDYGPTEAYGRRIPGTPIGDAAYTAVLEGLDAGTAYHVRVAAWHVAGGETEGDDLVFQTLAPVDIDPPAVPIGLHCEALGGGVSAIWEPNTEPDLLGYNVYRARQRDGTIDWSRAVILTSLPVTENQFFDSTAEEGTAYEYVVTAVDTSGNESSYSESAEVTVEPVAGALVFSTFPNPMRGETRFVYDFPARVGRAHLRIFSPSGRLVFEADVSPSGGTRGGPSALSWFGRDLSGRPVSVGVYLCELAAGDLIARRKLTILR